MAKSVKDRQKYFIERLFIACFIFIACFYFSIVSANAVSGNTCKTPTEEDHQKTTFCFFSLNNPAEAKELKKQYCGGKNKEKCESGKIEIKEFYGEKLAGESVEENFKKMLQTSECDSIVVSGHHTGYFAGKQSIDKNIKNQTLEQDVKHQTLGLDFMEEMSCEEGCEDWFSNVKSLFLMGCNTVKTPDNLKNSENADSKSISLLTKIKTPVTRGPIHKLVNQAYSSTLDQNNQMSHRYLRMFPESSVYGWGATSPSEGSQNSLPDFIDFVGHMQKTPIREPNKNRPVLTTEKKRDNILNFINFMNSQKSICTEYAAGKWAKHWVSRNEELDDIVVFNTTRATACYLKDKDKDQSQFKDHQRLGCDLTRALKSGNKAEINTAIDNILNSGPNGIRANFNRLMSLIISTKNKKRDWYPEVVEKLKKNPNLKSALLEDIDSDKVGFTRKSDYLYFYMKMGWQDTDKDKDKKISTKFLKQLQGVFDKIDANQSAGVRRAHRWAVFDSIAQNGLGKWLHKNDKDEFNKLQNQFKRSSYKWDQIQGHYLTYLGNPKKEEIEASDEFLKSESNPEIKEEIHWDICGYDDVVGYGKGISKVFTCPPK